MPPLAPLPRNHPDLIWRPWIGLPYRLGADPREGEACCCLNLTSLVLEAAGINPPPLQTEWLKYAKVHNWSAIEEAFYNNTKLHECQYPDRPAPYSICLLRSRDAMGLGIVTEARSILTALHSIGVATIPLNYMGQIPRFYKLNTIWI